MPAAPTPSDPSSPVAVAHIGVVVPDLEAAVRPYRDALGCTVTEPQDQPGAGITKCYVMFSNLYIEFIQPNQPDSPLEYMLEDQNAQDWLARHPAGGIHHVCLAVKDLNETRAAMAEEGFRMLGEGGGHGDGGAAISWVDPALNAGVILELKELPGGAL